MFDLIFGRKRILDFEIIFDSDNDVGVNIYSHVPEIKGPDYVRLWASYEAKIIYCLGFPKNVSAMIAIGGVAKVADRKITARTNCFKRAKCDDVVKYVTEPGVSDCKYTGEFYARGSFERIIQTRFPRAATEQQLVYSGLALMQNAIEMSYEDKETLEVLRNTAINFVKLYEAGLGVGLSAVADIPKLAYMKAIGIA